MSKTTKKAASIVSDTVKVLTDGLRQIVSPALLAIYAQVLNYLKTHYKQSPMVDIEGRKPAEIVAALVESCENLIKVARAFAGVERTIVTRASVWFLIGVFNPKDAKTSEKTDRKLVLPVQSIFAARAHGFITAAKAYELIQRVRRFVEGKDKNGKSVNLTGAKLKSELSALIDAIFYALGGLDLSIIRENGATFSARSLFFQYLAGGKSKEFVESFIELVREYKQIESDKAKGRDMMIATIERHLEDGITAVIERRMKPSAEQKAAQVAQETTAAQEKAKRQSVRLVKTGKQTTQAPKAKATRKAKAARTSATA